MLNRHDLDLPRAVLDPAGTFAHPWAVVTHPALPDAIKLELLRRWAHAVGAGGAAPPLRDEVHTAIDDLLATSSLRGATPRATAPPAPRRAG